MLALMLNKYEPSDIINFPHGCCCRGQVNVLPVAKLYDLTRLSVWVVFSDCLGFE